MFGFFRRNDDANADIGIPSTAPRLWKVYSSDGNEVGPAVTASSSLFDQLEDQEEEEEPPPPYARRGRSQRSTRLRVDAAGIVHGNSKYGGQEDDDDELYGRSRSRRMPGYGNGGLLPQQSIRCDHHLKHNNNDGNDYDDDMDISVDEIRELKAIAHDGSSVTTAASVRRYRRNMLFCAFCLLLAMVVALAVSIALSEQNKREQHQNQLATAAAIGGGSSGGGGSNGGSNGQGSESESQSDHQQGDDDDGDDNGDDDGDGDDDDDSPIKPPSPSGPTRMPSSSPPSSRPPHPSPQPHPTDDGGSCKDFISVNKDCFDRGDTIVVEFKRCHPEMGDWIGMYPAWSESDGQYLYPDYLYWAWTCGEYPCQGSELVPPQMGTIRFEAQTDNGEFQFHLISGSKYPYYSVAASDEFEIKKSCYVDGGRPAGHVYPDKRGVSPPGTVPVVPPRTLPPPV